MTSYHMRRQVVHEQVQAGNTVAEYIRGDDTAADIPRVQDQGDVEMYSYKSQGKRSKLKRSPQIVALIQELWGLAAQGADAQDQKNYITMIRKFHLLIVPPGSEDDIEKVAQDDWERDSKGASTLSYELFFESIWQLVDTWTETTEEEEYARCPPFFV
uniref:Uncharacterized protein n=1 Tax=Octactis speculum TaxID=3111310 RepID=A0A7S2CF38_9STRA|mmetsp:Transcript_35275/g.47638  ORF Transcript_35275/g.47638 Transcript_35275/m.47638 type:complete len:158 (+) Transcript_35275:375-848(+)